MARPSRAMMPQSENTLCCGAVSFGSSAAIARSVRPVETPRTSGAFWPNQRSSSRAPATATLAVPLPGTTSQARRR